MTQLLDVKNMARWIRRDGAEQILMRMTQYLEEDFRRWERFEKTPRIASHTPLGVIELMPTLDGELYSFKYVNGHPSNPARGFQTVTAFGVLADVDNGYPVFLAEMTLLTALRTAATSAMAARALARPDSRTLALIGAGSQSEFQALAFRGVLGIEELRVFDIDPAAMEKVRGNLEPLGFRVHLAASVDDAVDGADIITTCTADKARNTILGAEQVRPGVHVNAIGGDCPGKTELEARILEEAGVFVEFTPQTRIEGEIQQMAEDFPVTELWQVLTGAAAGRTDPAQVTVFDSVGFAISDFSALRCARDATAGSALQDEVDLVAQPDDPKDLFSLVDVLSPVG
ncbi:ornithine cyclodeaminase [Brachybacterium saurashtrense]|uniref:Ornithine cyclodeaminase n=1 Tax=Brachybacterium saurashtrense TaxID=556288 RepID=A0A345YK34_9MICO|nr:ornithine cyclodeaminase [Brachybacterium saurashtrense]AXK44286.1 ornithine cyclodeaminase [Brachybacterium saurashtrense]RRR21322.1 ornithine cyclodeaminase [Brachybacterium saurashtrense]RRR22897.1 ornithine cyclodeaminase [Brachybacterium saurashtrense]